MVAAQIVSRVYIKTRAILQEIGFRINGLMTDLSQVRYFVVFLGNPRSGTTLVRSLLDAHPNIAIANEVHSIRLMEAGKNWQEAKAKVEREALLREHLFYYLDEGRLLFDRAPTLF